MRSTVIAGAAVAFVVQSAALTAGALWAGWRLHQWHANLIAAVIPPQGAAQPSGPKLRIVGGPDDGVPR